MYYARRGSFLKSTVEYVRNRAALEHEHQKKIAALAKKQYDSLAAITDVRESEGFGARQSWSSILRVRCIYIN